MLRIFRHHMAYSSLLLAAAEGLVVFLVSFTFSPENFAEFSHATGGLQEAVEVGLLSVFCLLLLMAGFGLYNKQHFVDYRDMFARMAFAFVASVPLFFFVFYVYSSWAFTIARIWHASFLLTLLITLAGVALVRILFLLIGDIESLKRRILVYGVGEQAAKIFQFVRDQRHVNFTVAGYVRADNEAPAVPQDQVIHNLDQLTQIAREHRASEIVVAVRERRGLPMDELLACRTAGIAVTDCQTFWEREAGKVELEGLRPSWMVFSDGFQVGMIADFMKRCFDLAVSLAFLAFTLPLLIITAIAIRLDSKGPIFYRQERVGRDGRPYTLFKFRSMRVDAEKDGVARWAAERDPRITRIGQFIRMTRIDEIPQIINVLKGDMSFIGPRPERPVFVDELAEQIPFYGQRHQVRPGISGWAQINYPYGASVEDARQKLSYDLYYIKNYSLLLDMIILIETIRVVLWPRGVR